MLEKLCQPSCDLRTVEKYLERAFNKGRKDISGRGALTTKVRIIDDVVMVKMKMDYSGLEKKMFRYITGRKEEAHYYQSVREESKSYAKKIMDEIHPPMNVKTINFRIDVDNDFAFTIIVLDEDFEKLIRDGIVTRPDQMPE